LRELPTEESADTLREKISQISKLVQSRSNLNPVNSTERSDDSPDDSLGLNGIDQSYLDEVNTKLELARAYVDMEDIENARSLLDEVVKETEDFEEGKAMNEEKAG